ncbi:MAG: exosortase system-associated protein, TIGR04073 family [Candidatus Auribacterota bacterium]|jgi:putative exosortase-associated protein (TIGR04073 family)|nr:exosortase system-associated protein, TIGR04073 family [Candidatus Auribacterota bacterium]
MKRVTALLVFVALSICGTIYAQPFDMEPSSGAEISELQEKAGWAGEKFTRGITNLLTGWLELFNQPAVRADQDGIVAGLTTGIGEGVVWTLVRTGAGVWDAVTWPGAMIIPDAKPVIDPPSVFEDSIMAEYK